MAEGISKKGMTGFGLYLVVGPIIVSVARLAGLGPPSSNTAYSEGGEIVYWIGTAISIVIGIVLIVQGLRTGEDQKKKKDS